MYIVNLKLCCQPWHGNRWLSLVFGSVNTLIMEKRVISLNPTTRGWHKDLKRWWSPFRFRFSSQSQNTYGITSVAQISTNFLYDISVNVLSCAQTVIIALLFANSLEGMGEIGKAFITKQFPSLSQLAKAKAATGVYSWAEQAQQSPQNDLGTNKCLKSTIYWAGLKGVLLNPAWGGGGSLFKGNCSQSETGRTPSADTLPLWWVHMLFL